MADIPADVGVAGRTGLGVARVTVSAGFAALLIFVLCWAGTFIPYSSPTHALIGLFTPAPMGSVEALTEGSFWSLLFGALSGAVFALVYNGTARFASR